MRTKKLYDFAPILNNSIHIRIFNPSIFANNLIINILKNFIPLNLEKGCSPPSD